MLGLCVKPSISASFESARVQAPLSTDPFHSWTRPDGRIWAGFHRWDSGYLIRFLGQGDFFISADGSIVRCWPVPDAMPEAIQHLYSNQIVPLALSRRQKLILHGSAVSVNGFAIAFVGASGKGKSTLAASFSKSGGALLTDDSLLLQRNGSAVWYLLPGHPSIRLWPDSADALMANELPERDSHPETAKRSFVGRDTIQFCKQPLRLGYIFLLGDSDVTEPVIAAMRPGDAAVELVKNSFLLYAGESQTLQRHFEDVCGVIQLLGAYRLDYPRRFDDLPRVREAVMAHVCDRWPQFSAEVKP